LIPNPSVPKTRWHWAIVPAPRKQALFAAAFLHRALGSAARIRFHSDRLGIAFTVDR
jgi:hypothetical protein